MYVYEWGGELVVYVTLTTADHNYLDLACGLENCVKSRSSVTCRANEKCGCNDKVEDTFIHIVDGPYLLGGCGFDRQTHRG